MAPHPRPQEPVASHQTIIDRLNNLKPVDVSAKGKPLDTVTPIRPINREKTNSPMYHKITSPMLPTNPTDRETNQGSLSLNIKKPLPLPRTIILQHLKPVYVADPIIATKPETTSANSTDSEVPGKPMHTVTPIHPINETTTYPMQPTNMMDDETNKGSRCPDNEDQISSQETIQDCLKSLKRVNGTDPATPTIAKDQVTTSEDLNSVTSGNCTNPVSSKIHVPSVIPRITAKSDAVPDDPTAETAMFPRKYARIAGKPTVLALLNTPLPPKSSLKPVKK